ncbi:MAG: LacI family DNA-binding transcriptional regulator [Planctomycetes bacterium]|nr:LacI family DNA-binding transcriptional regulator [Planctomycetota bacterium]
MRITQHDIARKANVSQSTVSRVLAGDAKVDASLRRRVQEVLEAENYFRNARAAGLRKRSSAQVGVVLKRPARSLEGDPFVSVLVSCMTEVLRPADYHLCVEVASSSAEQAHIYEQLLRSDRVDGVVVLEPEMRDARFAQLLEDRFPFVVVGDPGEVAVPSVDNDNVMAGALATRHLLEAGCARVGMIAGPDEVRFSEDRIRGYVQAMRAAGQPPRVWHSAFGPRAARETARRAFDEDAPPDALVVLDDAMALGAVSEAQRLGLRVPEDLALVGFNDSGLCELVEGGLSSVALNIEDLIRKATEELLEMMRGRKPIRRTRELVPCSLVARRSSARGGRA